VARSLTAQIRRKIRSREYGGSTHRILRANLAPLVVAGAAICAECGHPISPTEKWDLAHVRGDRSRYAGPAHARCNRNTAGSVIERRSRRW
jgi:hypothetical protein